MNIKVLSNYDVVSIGEVFGISHTSMLKMMMREKRIKPCIYF